MVKERFDFIDIAKCIGIVLVVCSHSICNELMYLFNGCFIPLFYVLSGYCFTKVDVKGRAKRLLKPYFFFSILILVLICISGLKPVTWNTLLGIMYSRYALYRLGTVDNIVLMNIGNSPLWFLTSMFLAFLLFYVLLGIRRKGWRLLLVIGYLFVTYLLSKISLLLPWSIDTSFVMALFIYSGYLLKRGMWRQSLLSNKILFLGIILYAFCFYINGYVNLSVGNFGRSVFLSVICGITGSIVLMRFSMWLAGKGQKLKDCLIRIGRHSLTIFCIQMPLLFLSERILKMVCGNDLSTAEQISGALLQVVFSIGTGYFISKVLTKRLSWIFS